MKRVPKYIFDIVEQRRKAANKFLEADSILSDWIEEHSIELNTSDYGGGVDSILDANNSADNVIKALKLWEADYSE